MSEHTEVAYTLKLNAQSIATLHELGADLNISVNVPHVQESIRGAGRVDDRRKGPPNARRIHHSSAPRR